VLTMPLPCPRPTRVRLVLDPGAGLSSDSFTFHIPSEDLVDRLAAHLGDFLDRAQRFQARDRRHDDVDRIVGPQRFREDVVDAGEFQYRAHRAAGDDARALAGRSHDDVAGPDVDLDRVRYRALDHGYADQRFAR